MTVLKSLAVLSLLVGVAAIILTFSSRGQEAIFQTLEYIRDLCPESLRSKLPFSSPSDPLSKKKTNYRIFTKDELKNYRGEGNSKIYMAILGQVFDVTKGKKHYGPGGGYHFFTGTDGTRGFITGDFSDAGLSEDISDFDLQQIKGLAEWVEFYHTQYKFIGKLVGHFYDEEGKATAALEEYKVKVHQAKKQQDLDQQDVTKYPPCNSENKPGVYRRLWCSKYSGGIQRDWAGLPREYFRPGQREARCACVKNYGPPTDQTHKPGPHENLGDLNNPQFKVYSGCDPSADSCTFND